jgi:hypothetical protein
MLLTLLRGRLVFTPDFAENACDFMVEGDLSAVFKGLVAVPKALASPAGTALSYSPTFRGVWRSDRPAA